jgi:hypothetical protein
MSVRINRYRQETARPTPVVKDVFSSIAPVLLESTLQLGSDPMETSTLSIERIQPTIGASHVEMNDHDATLHASPFEQSSSFMQTMPIIYRAGTTPRAHVPIHNASQWFDGPNLQNERNDRMEKVVASLVRRGFRTPSTHG